MEKVQNQGFQSVEVEEERQKDKDSPLIKRHQSTIPEAKPILSQNFNDKVCPKTLIKQVRITVQPPQLFLSSMATTKGILPGVPRQQFALQKQTLYQHYITSNQYDLFYYRYSKTNTKQLPNRQLKRMFSKQYFCSYFIKLDFIKQTSNYTVRNLEQTSLEKQIQTPVHDVQFNSRFQCGNLFAVFKRRYQDDVYDLVLQNDVNTIGYNQWFYFSVRNSVARKVKIRIVNFTKPQSLFKKGMKPAVFSYRRLKRDKIGWERRGDKLQYGSTNYLREGESKAIYSYLSFQLNLQQNDITYIATTLPYSYTRLQNYLQNLQIKADKIRHLSYKCQKLTQTISFNKCQMVSLTMKRNKNQPKSKKKYVCIIGRQHPCETVGSFVMEGIIDFLVSGSSEAEELLKKYVFKIVPMMNPDGVIYGNSRCDISGADINRQWSFPSKSLYPTVEAYKTMMFRLGITGHDVEYFFDVHGHSKQLNSFIYGPQVAHQEVSLRLLPYIISKLNNNFVFSDCEFGLSIYKRKTARANVHRLMKFSHNSFTIQTSGYGYGNYYNSQHFTADKLNAIGVSTMMALFIEKFKPENNKEGIIIKEIEQEIELLLKQRKDRRERTKKTEQMMQEQKQKQESVNSGSDSQPSLGQLGIEDKQLIFLPRSLALQLKQASRLQQAQKQKEYKKQKKLVKSMSKQSNHTTQKSKKIVLQKLKLTNPVPFALSQPRNKVSKPKKIQIDKIPRGGVVPLSQIPMIVDLPDHPFKDSRRNRESLTQTIRKFERKSFFDNFRKEMDQPLDNKRHHRYSENSKEPIKLRQQIATVQTLQMKSYDSVDQLHQKRLSSLIQRSRRTQKLLIEKFQKPNWLYKNRSNRKL